MLARHNPFILGYQDVFRGEDFTASCLPVPLILSRSRVDRDFLLRAH